jgi:hypothetical protein
MIVRGYSELSYSCCLTTRHLVVLKDNLLKLPYGLANHTKNHTSYPTCQYINRKISAMTQKEPGHNRLSKRHTVRVAGSKPYLYLYSITKIVMRCSNAQYRTANLRLLHRFAPNFSLLVLIADHGQLPLKSSFEEWKQEVFSVFFIRVFWLRYSGVVTLNAVKHCYHWHVQFKREICKFDMEFVNPVISRVERH